MNKLFIVETCKLQCQTITTRCHATSTFDEHPASPSSVSPLLGLHTRAQTGKYTQVVNTLSQNIQLLSANQNFLLFLGLHISSLPSLSLSERSACMHQITPTGGVAPVRSRMAVCLSMSLVFYYTQSRGLCNVYYYGDISLPRW